MNSAQAQEYQRLRAHLSELRLSAAAESLTTVLDAARDEDLSPVTVLERLLGIEVAAVEARRHAGLLRFASLPAPYRIEDFTSLRNPAWTRNSSVSWPRCASSTTPAMCCWSASRAPEDDDRHRLRASRDRRGASGLLHHRGRPAKRCKRAALEGRWATAMRFFCGPRLLVIDEFAYARHNPDPEANAPLFEVIRRYLKSSTIVTSHAGIASWGERLSDPMLAASLLDRLLHRGVVVALDGPSYRMRAHQQRTDQLRKAIAAGAS
jgi:DNA replication protein DnaC